jgi:hypothetical protein
MDMFINEKYVCSSVATYGTRTDSGNDMMAGGHSHGSSSGGAKDSANIKTIASMSPCKGPFPVTKGDTLKLTAEYDLSKHPLRQSASGGKAADVMGMMGVSFAADHKQLVTFRYLERLMHILQQSDLYFTRS